MADLEKTIAIIFQGSDQVSKVTKVISKNFSNLTGKIESIASPLAGVADGILKADAALAAMAAGGLALAYKSSVDFESAVIELKKVIGDNAEALSAARQNAIDLSNQYGESAVNILASTANFRQAGFEVTEAMALTKNALDLVIAGDIEAAKASELLVSALKGFDAPASDAARLIDILNEVSNNYATNVEELATGMAKISPIADQMGFSMEETAGILTPVIEIFRSGDQAATALKTGLLKLLDDSKPVQAALEQLGVAQRDANGQLRSGKDILFDVAKAFTTAEESQKLFLTKELVGLEQSARMVTVFDNLTKSTQITATAMKAAGSAATEVAARLASAEVTLNRFKQGFANLSVAVGDQFKGAATGAIAGATEIELALKKAVDAGSFSKLFDALNEMGVELEAFFSGVAKALPEALESLEYSGLLDALDELGGSLSGLFGDLDLTTPEGLQKVLQGMVDSIEALIRVTSGMVEGFEPFIKAFKAAISQVNTMDKETQRVIGQILASAKAIGVFGVEIVAAINLIHQSGQDMGRTFEIILGSVQVLFNSVQLAFDVVFQHVVNLLQAAVWVLDKFTASLNLIPGLEGINKTFKDASKSLSDFNAGIQEHKLEQVDDFYRGFAKIIGETGEEAKGAAKKIKESTKELAVMGETASKTWDSLFTLDSGVTEEDFMGGVSQGFKDVSKDAEQVIEVVKKSSDEVLAFTNIPGHKGIFIEPVMDIGAVEKEVEKTIDTIAKKSTDIEKSLQWKAKVDIAEINAAAKTVKAAFEGVETGIKSTGTLMDDLWGRYFKAGAYDMGIERMTLRQQIEKEAAQREEQFELQQRLAEAQIDLVQSKSDGLGAMAIQVEAAGLEPQLEAILWYVLEAIQVRANEEAAEFLLGVNP